MPGHTVDQFRRVNLDLLYPRFRDMAFELVEWCNARGAAYFSTRGFATYAEQDAIFAQGRTAPGKIVTAARGGYSIHCFGGGTDFTHDSDGNPANGLQPDWSPENYECLVAGAAQFGLVSGKGFHDLPHIQIPGFVTGDEMAPLRAIWDATPGDDVARLAAVWKFLDERWVS